MDTYLDMQDYINKHIKEIIGVTVEDDMVKIIFKEAKTVSIEAKRDCDLLVYKEDK